MLECTTCYLLLATCYLLLATCYLLLASCYLLLATGYSLLTTLYSLLATRYSLLATRYSLLATRYSLLTTPLHPGQKVPASTSLLLGFPQVSPSLLPASLVLLPLLPLPSHCSPRSHASISHPPPQSTPRQNIQSHNNLLAQVQPIFYLFDLSISWTYVSHQTLPRQDQTWRSKTPLNIFSLFWLSQVDHSQQSCPVF